MCFFIVLSTKLQFSFLTNHLYKKQIALLVLDDNDMNCDSKEIELEKLDLNNAGLSMLVLQNYDLVVYQGSKGSKILKSKYTKKGIIL